MMIHKATYFRVLAGLFLIWDASIDAYSQELKLEGEFVQGGMVVGFTAPGANVKLDGKDVSISTQGVFVFGFGRDSSEKSVVRKHRSTPSPSLAPVGGSLSRQTFWSK